jgi:hypothetical protein
MFEVKIEEIWSFNTNFLKNQQESQNCNNCQKRIQNQSENRKSELNT